MRRADLFRWHASSAACLAAASLLAAAFLAPPSLAENSDAPAEVVSQEIDVRLAEIEVLVSDRQGNPIPGLTRDDFRVFQDGREVELTHFRPNGQKIAPSGAPPGTAITGTAAAASGGAAALPDDRLHLVVYVDRGYLEPGDLQDVRQALKGFLRQALRSQDRVMLVTAAHSLELLQGFTSVPELVVSKLDQVRIKPGGGRLNREYQNILLEMQRIKNEGHDLMARDATRQPRIFVSRIQAYTAEIEAEIRQTTAQLRQLIGSIAGLPGRRAVLYIGGRVPSAHGRRLFDAWEDAFGRNSSLQIADNPGGAEFGVGGGAGSDAASSDTGLDSLAAASASFDSGAQRAIEDVVKHAGAHGVVIHTLDAASQRNAGYLAPGDASLPARGASANPGAIMAAGSMADATASLRALAWGTGGRSMAGGRNFNTALERLGDGLKTYYSLGFRPLAPKGERSRIEVRLRPEARAAHGKLDVRHRSVLQLKDRDTLAAERTVSALLLEEIDNPLRVEASAGAPVSAGKGKWRVPVEVTVPLSKLALVADGRVHAGRLSIFAVSGGLERIGPVIKAVVPVRIPNQDLLTSLGRRVSTRIQLTLPTRVASSGIAITVRDDFRPQSSTAVTAVGLEGSAGAGSL